MGNHIQCREGEITNNNSSKVGEERPSVGRSRGRGRGGEGEEAAEGGGGPGRGGGGQGRGAVPAEQGGHDLAAAGVL